MKKILILACILSVALLLTSCGLFTVEESEPVSTQDFLEEKYIPHELLHIDKRFVMCQGEICFYGDDLSVGGQCAILDGNAMCGSYSIRDRNPGDSPLQIISPQPNERPEAIPE